MFKIKTSLIIALVVFLITLVLTVPNSYLINKFSAQINTLPVKISNTQGHITEGSSNVNYQGVPAKVSWTIAPQNALLGKLKGSAVIEILDSKITADFNVGLNSVELSNVNGQLSYLTLNEIGKSQRLNVEGDLSLIGLGIKISQKKSTNEQGEDVVTKTLENLAGQIIYTGGEVNSPQVGRLTPPRMVAKSETLEDKWKVKLTDDKDNLVFNLDFYPDGTIYVEGYKVLSSIINKPLGGTDPAIIQNHVFPSF